MSQLTLYNAPGRAQAQRGEIFVTLPTAIHSKLLRSGLAADVAPTELVDFPAVEPQRCRATGAVGRASSPAGASGFQPRLLPPMAL